MKWYSIGLTLVSLSICLCVLFTAAQRRPSWERNGCHLVGYTVPVEVAGCHKENVRMNACRGFCLTYSTLARYEQITSSKRYSTRGSCCSIQDTHEVIVILPCENNEQRSVVYRSAASCSCSLCSQGDD